MELKKHYREVPCFPESHLTQLKLIHGKTLLHAAHIQLFHHCNSNKSLIKHHSSVLRDVIIALVRNHRIRHVYLSFEHLTEQWEYLLLIQLLEHYRETLKTRILSLEISLGRFIADDPSLLPRVVSSIVDPDGDPSPPPPTDQCPTCGHWTQTGLHGFDPNMDALDQPQCTRCTVVLV